MIKQAPTPARIFAMVAFSFSCFAILLFLWLQFGGPVPLKAEGAEVGIPDAETDALIDLLGGTGVCAKP